MIFFFVQTCYWNRNFIVYAVNSNCCSFQSVARRNLAKPFGPASQTAPAPQQKHAAPIYGSAVTLAVCIPKERRRVTEVCVQYKPLAARQVWVRPDCKLQAKFKLHSKKSLGSQHLEECTGADTQQQTITANTWSVWHFAGPGPVASSCGSVIGAHVTKETSPLMPLNPSLYLCSNLAGWIHLHSSAHLQPHSWWLCNNTFTLISLAWVSTGILICPCPINQCWITCWCS